MIPFIIRIGFLCLVATGVYAAESTVRTPSQSSTKVDDIKNEVQGDIDEEITDIKLRADSGKKRRWSSSLFLNYAAGSLEDPGAPMRPILGNEKIAAPVSLSGNIGVRYRVNKNDSIFFATGLSQQQPFNNVSADQKKLELYTPQISYSSTFAMKDWELATSYRLYVNTLDYLRDFGLVATAGYSLSALNAIKTTRFHGGVSLNVYASAYDKHDDHLKAQQQDYGFGIHPSLQFNINDRANIYTSLSLFNFDHVRSESDIFRFENSEITQTVGVGYAFFRDFYVSPYVSFSPEDLSADRTTVNLRTTINL